MGVLFAGFMSALAGAFLSIGDIHTFTEGMTRGAGYLAIAAVVFGKWTLTGAVLACLLFGGATALQFQLPTLGVNVPNALLIMLPYLLARSRSVGWRAGKPPRARLVRLTFAAEAVTIFKGTVAVTGWGGPTERGRKSFYKELWVGIP
jgi:ABC-type uncharacterized transport system permease subunit